MQEIKSQVSEAHLVEFTPEQERRLWQKIDFRLIPILSLMYLFSFVDRGTSMHYHFNPYTKLAWDCSEHR